MNVALIVYACAGILWTLFSIRMQLLLYGNLWLRLIVGIPANLFLWPIAMFFAIFKVKKEIIRYARWARLPEDTLLDNSGV